MLERKRFGTTYAENRSDALLAADLDRDGNRIVALLNADRSYGGQFAQILVSDDVDGSWAQHDLELNGWLGLDDPLGVMGNKASTPRATRRDLPVRREPEPCALSHRMFVAGARVTPAFAASEPSETKTARR
jgi:hypothetical protein